MTYCRRLLLTLIPHCTGSYTVKIVTQALSMSSGTTHTPGRRMSFDSRPRLRRGPGMCVRPQVGGRERYLAIETPRMRKFAGYSSTRMAMYLDTSIQPVKGRNGKLVKPCTTNGTPVGSYLLANKVVVLVEIYHNDERYSFPVDGLHEVDPYYDGHDSPVDHTLEAFAGALVGLDAGRLCVRGYLMVNPGLTDGLVVS